MPYNRPYEAFCKRNHIKPYNLNRKAGKLKTFYNEFHKEWPFLWVKSVVTPKTIKLKKKIHKEYLPIVELSQKNKKTILLTLGQSLGMPASPSTPRLDSIVFLYFGRVLHVGDIHYGIIGFVGIVLGLVYFLIENLCFTLGVHCFLLEIIENHQ